MTDLIARAANVAQAARMARTLEAALLLGMALVHAPAAAQGAPMVPDLVIIAGHIITLQDPEPVPPPTAVAIREGRIVWLGSAAEAASLPATRVVRLPQAVVVPGLVDSHAHLTNLGRTRMRLDLVDTPTLAAVVDQVRTAPGDGWILGRGWDQNDWANHAFPDRAALDAVSTRPVALTRIDGHALYVNSVALAAAGITATTPDPPGGQILRRADGSPTGVLIDTAMEPVNHVIPPPDRAEVRAAIESAIAACHAVGLTGVHDAGTGALELSVLEELDAEGALPLRVYAMLWGDDPAIEVMASPGPRTGRMLTVGAVKLFADGALGSRGAWLKAPYADADTRGLPITHGPALQAAVRRYADLGFQVGVHAIGDAAAADVLTAFEGVLQPGNGRRFRIEHAQVVAPEDRTRMARLGVIAMVQPTHATSDMPWAEARLGPVRIHHAYAWRSLQKAGVPLALGSDFPVERPSPIDGLYAAVTRTDAQHAPKGGWYPEEALTAREALVGFTLGGAYAGFAEAHRGRIAVGQDADLTFLDANPLTIPPENLKQIKTLGVVVAGRPHGVP